MSRDSAAQAASRSTRAADAAARPSGPRFEAGQPERGEQAERDRRAVREPVAGRASSAWANVWPRLSCARSARSSGSRRQTPPCRAAPHLLLPRELPERLPAEQACLDDLREAVRELLLGQRLEQRRVERRLDGPVERTDEVLAIGEVDRRLAADRRVDLPDEGRGDGVPRDPAQVGRRDEADEVDRRATSDGDDRSVAVDTQRPPEPLGLRATVFAASPPGTRRVASIPCSSATVSSATTASPCASRAWRGGHPPRRGRRRRVRGRSVGDGLVQRPSQLVSASEAGVVPRQRALAAAHALPRRVDVDVDVDDERVEPFHESGGLDRPAPDRDDARLPATAHVGDELRLELAERRFPRVAKTSAIGPWACSSSVDVAERPPQPVGDLLAERRLARPHEADEDEVPV